ncbi:MAG: hypothetical protein P9X24_10160 [Candidatus Hatepunaea meridiana]|nr:hypothetical protein [Candidatus Hatepunaea meridiana]
MRRLLILLLFAITLLSGQIIGQDVNGDLFKIDNKTILKVYGSHYERGYAHGFLLAEEVKVEIEQFFILYVFSNDLDAYAQARTYFIENFTVERKYQDEIRGIFDGISDSDVGLFMREVDRDIEQEDILAFTGFTDLATCGLFNANANFGCSTLADWGRSTENDGELQGDLVVSRALDGHMEQIINQNHSLIVHFPSEEDETPWANICFPGMVSTFSCIGQHGVAAFQNFGGRNRITDEENLHPVMLAIRNGIEVYDVNGDDMYDPDDIRTAIESENSLTPWIVTAVDIESGIVIETNNENGTEVRNEENNTVIPNNNIAATNHYRVLYQLYACNRYANIADSLERDCQCNDRAQLEHT